MTNIFSPKQKEIEPNSTIVYAQIDGNLPSFNPIGIIIGKCTSTTTEDIDILQKLESNQKISEYYEQKCVGLRKVKQDWERTINVPKYIINMANSKLKHWIKKITKNIYSHSDKNYFEVEDADYYSSFGIEKENGEWIIKDKCKIKFAYSKAWENRDFEINKFWTRAAYFWAFIVLIFGAYFKTSENKADEFIQLIIICLGVIFSIAWHYVIRGSKRWQENWELHIDKLEDFISGPLYKTIFHRNTFYSVSKINEILSLVIIVVWFALLWNFLDINSKFPWQKNATNDIDLKAIMALLVTLVFSLSIICGHSRKKYNNAKERFIRRKNY